MPKALLFLRKDLAGTMPNNGVKNKIITKFKNGSLKGH